MEKVSLSTISEHFDKVGSGREKLDNVVPMRDHDVLSSKSLDCKDFCNCNFTPTAESLYMEKHVLVFRVYRWETKRSYSHH